MDSLTRLRGLYFFEHLSPEELAALAAICKLRRYVAGNDLLTQGEQTTHFFLVDEGHINLRHTDRGGFERPIGSKGPGEYFGVKMFTTQEPSDYTFEAVDAALVWVIDRKAWDELVENQPTIMEHLPELRAEYARLTRGLEWLSPGEVINLTTRRHWWALVLMIRVPLAVALVFTLAYVISGIFGVTTTYPQILYVYLVVIVIVLLWLGWEALNWYNDTYIVTNKRVVRINKVLFFSDSRQDLAISKIQSQRVNRGGPISVFLNIADLRITSAASEEGGVLFEQVGGVQQIQQAIDKERQYIAERTRATERERLRHQIAGEIEHYVLAQPAVPEPKAKSAAPVVKMSAAPARRGLRLPVPRLPRLFQRRPKMVSKPVPLGKRIGAAWHEFLGTEFRQGGTVTWRKERLVLLNQMAPALALFAVIVFLTIFFVSSGVPFDLINNGVFAALAVLMLLTLGWAAWELEDWRRDLYRLSDAEIVDIESLPFGLRYQEKKAELRNIQDVTTSRTGFINVILDFGNVDTRVAGNAAPFTFTNVKHPRLVADEITERIEALKLRGQERTNREQTRTIVDAIVAYHRLLMTERHQNAPVPVGDALPVSAIEDEQAAPPATALASAVSAPENGNYTASASRTSPPSASNDDESEFPSEADING